MMDPRLVAEIQKLETQHGEITAEIVYQAGKKPGTALHEYLTSKDVFDKNKAQYHWGVEVCRDLIRKIVVKIESQEYTVKIPKYVRNPDADPNVQSMVNVNRLSNERKRDALLPYLNRALSNLITAINISDGTGCTTFLNDLHEQIQGTIEMVQQHKVKATRITRKGNGKDHHITP